MSCAADLYLSRTGADGRGEPPRGEALRKNARGRVVGPTRAAVRAAPGAEHTAREPGEVPSPPATESGNNQCVRAKAVVLPVLAGAGGA
jgi:hypothetical protein